VAHEQAFPGSETADRALTYAMTLAVELGQADTAIALGERLLKTYPLSIFDLQVKYQLGLLRERVGEIAGAAAAMDDFAASVLQASGDPGARGQPVTTVALGALPERRRKERLALLAECTRRPEHWLQNGMFNAGLWHAGAGAWGAAHAAWSRYLARFGDQPDAPAVAARMVELLERQGRTGEAVQAIDTLQVSWARDPRVTEAMRLSLLDRQLTLLEQLERPAEVTRRAQHLVARLRRIAEAERGAPSTRDVEAHARFALLEPDFRAYQALRFERGRAFREALAQKERRLQELEAAYAGVLALGNAEYGLAALTRIGLLYADLAARVGDVQPPPGLDEEQQALFRTELESRYVFPLEAKATAALEKAVAKASELGLFGPALAAAQDQLNVYRPGASPPARLVVLSPPPPRLRLEPIRTSSTAVRADDAARFRQALDALDQGRTGEAASGFADALRGAPAWADAQFNLGLAAQRAGRLPAALQAWEGGLRIDPRHRPSSAALAQGLLVAGRLEDAIRVIEATLEDPGSRADAALGLAAAEVFRAAHREARAAAAAQAVLARHPDDPRAWLSLGLVALQVGQLPLAEYRLERARRLAPDDPEVQVALGQLAARQSRPHLALSAFQRALERDPDHLPALEGLGMLALAWRDAPRAARVLERAATLAPDSAEVQLALAWALHGQSASDPAFAVRAGEAFARAVQLGSSEPQAVCAAGWAFASAPAGRERARQWLERCRDQPTTPASERERIEARLALLVVQTGASP
jgi:tetratricopeptide (TPR) repeat protein